MREQNIFHLVTDNGLIQGVQTAVEIAKSAKELLDSKEFCYTNDDQAIIEFGRKTFESSFPGQPLPVQLKYYHELIQGTEPQNYKKPPSDLPKTYTLNNFSFGNNAISPLCQAGVVSLITYLNCRNERFTVGTTHTEGHRNDAIAQIFNLVMQALVIFSRVNLHADLDSLSNLKQYIEFIGKIRDYENPKLKQGWHGTYFFKDKGATSEQRLTRAKITFEEIQSYIERAYCNKSVETYFWNLKDELINFCNDGFNIVLRIISEKVIDTCVTMKSIVLQNQGSHPLDEKAHAAYKLTDKSISSLNELMTRFAQFLNTKMYGTKKEQPIFLYDTDLDRWVCFANLEKESSGVYTPCRINYEIMQSFKILCVQIQKAAINLNTAHLCAHIGQLGGALISRGAAKTSLEKTVEIIKGLISIAKEHFDGLFLELEKRNDQLKQLSDHQRSSADNIWLQNFNCVEKTKLSKHIDKIIDTCGMIEKLLKEKTQDQTEKEIQEKIQELNALLKQQNMETVHFGHKLGEFKHEEKREQKLANPPIITSKDWTDISDLLKKYKNGTQHTSVNGLIECYHFQKLIFLNVNNHAYNSVEIILQYQKTQQDLIKIDSFFKEAIESKEEHLTDKHYTLLFHFRGKIIHQRVALFEHLQSQPIAWNRIKELANSLEEDFKKKLLIGKLKSVTSMIPRKSKKTHQEKYDAYKSTVQQAYDKYRELGISYLLLLMTRALHASARKHPESFLKESHLTFIAIKNIIEERVRIRPINGGMEKVQKTWIYVERSIRYNLRKQNLEPLMDPSYDRAVMSFF